MKLLTLMLYTLRELSAKAMLIILASISTLGILLAVVAVAVQNTAEGQVLLLFGQQASPPLGSEQLALTVAQLQASMAGGLFTGIILFGVIATAGVIPDSLEKGIVDVYLSKPIGRWELLLGKALGAVAAIFVNIAYFIGVMWLVLALKIGIWSPAFLLAGLVMTFIFACLYSVSGALGAISRSTVIAILGTYVYLLIVAPLLQNREGTFYLLSSNSVYRTVVDAVYYLLPQLGAMQEEATKLIVQKPIRWEPFAQSLASSSAIFLLAAFVVKRKDF
jgi:ABC-type transport system involved in multi-copper enzyme maturation permease subunit